MADTVSYSAAMKTKEKGMALSKKQKRAAADARTQNTAMGNYQAMRHKAIQQKQTTGKVGAKTQKRLDAAKKKNAAGPLSWANFKKAYVSKHGAQKGQESWAKARDSFYDWRQKRGSAVQLGEYSRNDAQTHDEYGRKKA